MDKRANNEDNSSWSRYISDASGGGEEEESVDGACVDEEKGADDEDGWTLSRAEVANELPETVESPRRRELEKALFVPPSAASDCSLPERAAFGGEGEVMTVVKWAVGVSAGEAEAGSDA